MKLRTTWTCIWEGSKCVETFVGRGGRNLEYKFDINFILKEKRVTVQLDNTSRNQDSVSGFYEHGIERSVP
jgi:hypothetical protein